jgi:hypothetical protein
MRSEVKTQTEYFHSDHCLSVFICGKFKRQRYTGENKAGAGADVASCTRANRFALFTVANSLPPDYRPELQVTQLSPERLLPPDYWRERNLMKQASIQDCSDS